MKHNSQTIFTNLKEHLTQIFDNETSVFLVWLKSILTIDNIIKLIGTVIIILIAWIIYRILINTIKKSNSEKITFQRAQILKRIIKYIFYIVIIMCILNLFGIKLSAIWGAAGIAGVAIGFAAQTSVSNIISGIFVLTEGALKIGDTIVVGGVTGIVDSISLLSVRIHTYDNQMVRIPNSTIINTNLTNNSYHSVRRITINVDVSYVSDLNLALETLLKVPDICPSVIKEPNPKVWIDGFGESGIHLTLAAWFKSEDLISAKNQLYIGIKQLFDQNKISIPYNQLDLHISQTDHMELNSSNI